MIDNSLGRILLGDEAAGRSSYERFKDISVDLDLMDEVDEEYPKTQWTVGRDVSVSGMGTFLGKERRTVTVAPAEGQGWWFDRCDLPNYLPTKVSVRNVWTTGDVVSNIVLRSGSPHNYVRMVEHIVALKLGLGLDNLVVRFDSGDPPLFNRGSLDLIEAVEQAGFVDTGRPVSYYSVREKVTCIAPSGGFLTIEPPLEGRRRLTMDCAVDFPNILGRQRIRFPLSYRLFRKGSVARTNTTSGKKLYCQTIGKLFADVRNLGYNNENVSVAGATRYLNEPRLIHHGKSLEAVWHRSVLDLLAALALIEEGRFVGHVTSYRAGHTLDVEMITQLYIHGLLANA
ncbi:MAG: hypothetical protein EOL87_13515 [Spartobacteria bacterium]|nr:hypothetical protein [Spartobacteria bacterium]